MAEAIVELTSLVKSKHVPDRWYAEFSTGETLEVNVALIADFSLYTGRELAAEEFAALKKRTASVRAKARALRILGQRQMSQKELEDRLIERGESPEDASEAVRYLADLGLMDDGEYAASIVRHYAARGYGKGRIRQEFYRRGVPKELWEEALRELPEGTEAIDGLIERRLRGTEPDRRELKRLTDMLLRRGYGWEEIRSAMARYADTEELTDE